jgi:hypothetical protein
MVALEHHINELGTIDSIAQSLDRIADASESIRAVAARLRTAKQESMMLPPARCDGGSPPPAAELAAFVEKLTEALSSSGLEQALSVRSPAMRIGPYQVNFLIHNLQLAADFAAKNDHPKRKQQHDDGL